MTSIISSEGFELQTVHAAADLGIATRERTRVEDEGKMPTSEPSPRDKYGLVYGAFFGLGVGFLLPWNAFITAIDYFEMLYPGAHADRVFSLCYMFPNLLGLCAMLRYNPAWFPTPARINLGYALFLGSMLVVPVVDILRENDEHVPPNGLHITGMAVVILGLSDGLVQGSLFGLSAQMPSQYTQALMAGTACSGLITSVLRIATKMSVPNTRNGLRLSANVYFAVAALGVLSCLIMYHMLQRSPVYRFYHEEEGRHRAKHASDAAAQQVELAHIPILEESRLADGESSTGVHAVGAVRAPTAKRHASVRVVMHKVWPNAVSVAGVYVVTLAIFPGFLAEDVKSEALGDWYPVLLITTFNVADLAGKITKTGERFERDGAGPAHLLLSTTALRFIFIPAFAFCAMGPEMFRAEVVIVALTLALGWSSGWLATAAMVTAPPRVLSHEEECAGNVMVFSLILGLALGAMCGWTWLL